MIDPNVKLTEHFTLKEMTASASHPEIYNVPPIEKVDNIKHVCEWLEALRALYNVRYPAADGKEQPIRVNSCYRSPLLNRAVGGAQHSNHLDGCAVDIRCPGKEANQRATMALRYAMLLIEISESGLMGQKKEYRFDELILERKGTNWWVHFAVRPDRNRMWITCLNKS